MTTDRDDSLDLAGWAPQPRRHTPLPPLGPLPHWSNDAGAWIDLSDALIEALDSGDPERERTALGCLEKGALEIGPSRDGAPWVCSATRETWWLTYLTQYGGLETGSWRDSMRLERGVSSLRRRVLVVGGGHSRVAAGVAGRGHDVTVLDSSRLIVSAMRLVDRSGSQVEYVAGDLVHASQAPGPFDAVLCHRVLNNWPMRHMIDEVLDALVRRLTPDGRLEIEHVETCQRPSSRDLEVALVRRGLRQESHGHDSGQPGRSFSVTQTSH